MLKLRHYDFLHNVTQHNPYTLYCTCGLLGLCCFGLVVSKLRLRVSRHGSRTRRRSRVPVKVGRIPDESIRVAIATATQHQLVRVLTRGVWKKFVFFFWLLTGFCVLVGVWLFWVFLRGFYLFFSLFYFILFEFDYESERNTNGKENTKTKKKILRAFFFFFFFVLSSNLLSAQKIIDFIDDDDYRYQRSRIKKFGSDVWRKCHAKRRDFARPGDSSKIRLSLLFMILCWMI